MSKISYEHPSHVADVPNRKKNILNDSKAPLRKKNKIHMGKDDVKGEKYFGENVYGNEISIYPTPSGGYSWLSIDSKDSSCNIFEIPTNFVLKFGFELKELLPSPTNWVNKILGKPLYEKALFAARVYDVVQVTSKLLIHREKEGRGMVWCSILTRWSITSHTIITTRGEFTFTLKNVTCLTPENVKITLLSFLHTTQHIFSRCFDYGIILAIVLVAIKIAQGMYFPLALLYLGNIYKTLDYYHLKTKILLGRYKILSYVDMSFIQIYFWERFSACAHPPSPGSFATSSSKFTGNNYRAWFGISRSPKETFFKVFLCHSQATSSFKVNSTMLPYMIENSSVGTNIDSHSMEVYSMCRVVRKHRRPPLSLDVKFLDCVFEFLFGIINERLKEIISCVILVFDRTTQYSSNSLAYWR
uniref:Uncharacterized protein n=1 Tax=Gossypium raimondii TaxID=29730 RepID=A0A0D2SR20_GOSRA|nr:hypothetical protein B456_010G113700 [Gossypium raimondii]